MILALVISFWFATVEENKFIDEYQSLSHDDQQVLESFYNKLPDYTGIYTIVGLIYYAVTLGLFLLLSKIWYLKKF